MSNSQTKIQLKQAAKWLVKKAPREGDDIFGLWSPEPKQFWHDGEARPLLTGEFHYLNSEALRLNNPLKL